MRAALVERMWERTKRKAAGAVIAMSTRDRRRAYSRRTIDVLWLGVHSAPWLACWMAVLCACGRYEFAECDRCGPAGLLRCVDGVEQLCIDDGNGCVGWGGDVPCTAGACANDGFNLCAITPCPDVPVEIAPQFVSAGATTCLNGPPNAYFAHVLAQLTDGPSTLIDGYEVSACWVADFGACTPYLVGVNAELNAAATSCGDNCGGPCQRCGDTTKDAVALVFDGPTLDDLRIRTTVDLMAGSTTGGSSGLTPRRESRFMAVCRPACGPTGWNLGVGPFVFGN